MTVKDPTLESDGCPECGSKLFFAEFEVAHEVRQTKHGFEVQKQLKRTSGYRSLYCSKCSYYIVQDGEKIHETTPKEDDTSRSKHEEAGEDPNQHSLSDSVEPDADNN